MADEGRYGQLPFDQFALTNWDFSLPTSKDQSQWLYLTKRWFALTLKERKPYIDAATTDRHFPNREQVERVLVPYQTQQERLINPFLTHDVSIWLRTCYAPGLARAYADMADFASEIVDNHQVLDDATLYDFGQNWDRILERMPSLCDCDYWGDIALDEAVEADPLPPVDDPTFALHDAIKRQVVMIYLIDRQALEEKLITLLWLDAHGECVWWFKLDPENLLEFAGWMARGAGLMMLAQFDCQGVWEKGSLIDWIF
ncbi:hypothetical protein FB567DRAFT_263506 [Paraphoma chrysanthemicola]|uniref:Uncharacterized protein n=1 Tax=Paraphoma chrysanthemicola TaxID=798071 RepID=A0A8K0W1K7_9PLEO|nr:hypothetical protein FB567DRAFT_263506 [Paraphoma chrysanthemicola]